MEQDWEVQEIFAKAKAIITGSHFVYTKKPEGWFHGDTYVNKDAVYPRVRLLRQLCEMLVDHFAELPIRVVVGPTIGGVGLSQHVADRWISGGVRAVFAEEEDVLEEMTLSSHRVLDPGDGLKFQATGLVNISFLPGTKSISSVSFRTKTGTRRVLKRGYHEIVMNQPCLVVEDVLTTGSTVQKTIEAVRRSGGEVLAVAALCNRSGGKVTAETLGVPELFSLLNIDFPTYPEASCPICKEKGMESVRTDLGKGGEFLARMGIKP
jgi:orotate phosphoribosyltransferase